MRQADITFTAYNLARTVAAMTPHPDDERRFMALYAYALDRRDVDQARQLPSAEVLARKHGEISGTRFSWPSLPAAPREVQLFWAAFRGAIETLEPFRDETTPAMFPPFEAVMAAPTEPQPDRLAQVLADAELEEDQEKVVRMLRFAANLNGALNRTGLTPPDEIRGHGDRLAAWLIEEIVRLEKAQAAEKLVSETIAHVGADSVDELRDLASVGKSLMDTIAIVTKDGPLKGWAPAEEPAEIVTDLMNMLHDATTGRAEAEKLLSEAQDALQAAPPEHPAPLPPDVAELVVAARIVAYQPDGADADEHQRLDKALEAFAERVPWDDMPSKEDDEKIAGADEPGAASMPAPRRKGRKAK